MRIKRRRPRWSANLYSLVAPGLVLATPFLVFLHYHRYSHARIDTIVCLLVLLGVGFGLGALARHRPWMDALVLAATSTFLIDIQSDRLRTDDLLGIGAVALLVLWIVRLHAARIATFMAGTMALSSLVMPAAATTAQGGGPEHGNPKLPLMLHVILDEHIGIEGLPALPVGQALGEELRSFFAVRDFRLLGGAYSEYFNSNRSLSHLVNFAPREYDATLFETGTGGFEWNLKRNRYFAELARQGYALHVYQSNYLQVCPGSTTHCETYSGSGIGILQETTLSLRDRLRLIASVYLDRSILYKTVKNFYRRAQKQLAQSGVAIPAWNWGRNRVGAITSTAVMEKLRQELAGARRGDFVFAHLLLPHHPYVYDETCALLPLDAWEERTTSESRQALYDAYAQQVRCALRELDETLRAIPTELARDAVIIVQGDHGSRMGVFPTPRRAPLMQRSDYADSYSTLFAVRSPRLEAGYDSRQAPITCLLKTLFENDYASLAGLDGCAGRPSVFLVGDGKAYLRPLPPFGETAHSQETSVPD